ncbi:MAG TPA: hypothetical protein ENK91_10590 [Bacteroidetes bacterium]|nr:hypothetical protein [Bacteroidota bacterium]
MVKINFNQKLFDTHIEEISKKINQKLENINHNGLSNETINCLKYLESEIENMLKANTNELESIINLFKTNYPSSIGVVNQQEEGWQELYKILRKEIFEKEYNLWSDRKKYGAYAFVKELGLETCPYCNRNYTFIVDSDNGKLRAEIDHFYPKSIYPFLAMSFYNLIPSCSICNHTKGNTIHQNLENPYDTKEDSYRFTYTPNSVDFATVEAEKYNFDSFEIDITGNPENIELFKLEKLYKQHKDIVLELLIKKAYYPESYVQELSHFGFSQDEIYRYLLGNYKQDEDLHKRPLSKLIRDISQELGIV